MFGPSSFTGLPTPGYDDILVKNDEMKQVYERTPDTFRRRDVGEFLMDSSDTILERCTLEILHLKGFVVLRQR
jgi:hypothetical protein